MATISSDRRDHVVSRAVSAVGTRGTRVPTYQRGGGLYTTTGAAKRRSSSTSSTDAVDQSSSKTGSKSSYRSTASRLQPRLDNSDVVEVSSDEDEDHHDRRRRRSAEKRKPKNANFSQGSSAQAPSLGRAPPLDSSDDDGTHINFALNRGGPTVRDNPGVRKGTHSSVVAASQVSASYARQF